MDDTRFSGERNDVKTEDEDDDVLMYQHKNRHYYDQLFTSSDSSTDPLLCNDHSDHYFNHYHTNNIDNHNKKDENNSAAEKKKTNKICVSFRNDAGGASSVSVTIFKKLFSGSKQVVVGNTTFVQLSTVIKSDQNNNNCINNKCINQRNSEINKFFYENKLTCKTKSNSNILYHQNCCCCCPYQQTLATKLDQSSANQMAPNRRSIPTSLSLSDSSDPESWGSSPINNNNVNKIKTTNGLVQSEMPVCNSDDSRTHYFDTKVLSYSQLNKSNNVNANGVNNIDKDKINSVNVSSSSTLVNHNHHNNHSHHHHHSSSNYNNNNYNHHACRNWPKIDFISSIDPFESTDSMISAFACVAHVVNSDSANEEDQIDGDNEIIGIDDDDSENEQGNEDDDGNGSYDSSNHPNSLESPENYRPIRKLQSLGFSSNDKIANSNSRKFIGKCSSNNKFTSESDQVNLIKPLPPPLSTLPRPSQQPPSPPLSSLIPTSAPNSQQNLSQSSSKVPSSITKPITAKDHLYETIYPSNIRLTRDSKYFVDYQNYRPILNQPVAPISSLDSSSKGISHGNNHSCLNDNIQNLSSKSLIQNKGNMVRRQVYTTSPKVGNYKNIAGRSSISSTSSIVNHSYNQQQQQKNYHYQAQRSTQQSYNHRPSHQHYLPGLNSSSFYKPSLSPSSSSLLSSPLPSSSSPTPPKSNQGNQHLQQLGKKSGDSMHQNSSESKTSAPVNRPALLQLKKPTNSLSKSFDQLDSKFKPSSSTIEISGDSKTTPINEDKSVNQVTIKSPASDLKPDQVYPNSVTLPIISRANVRPTEEYATVNKTRSIKSVKSLTLAPVSPTNDHKYETKSLSKDDSLLSTESGTNKPIGSPISLPSSPISPSKSLSTPSSENNSLNEPKGRKSKHKDKLLSPSSGSSSSRSFLAKFFSLTHVISRTFSVEKIDKHRQLNIQGKGTLIKSAVSTPALSSTRPGFLTDLNGNNQVNNQFPSINALLIESGCTSDNQENVEPVSLTTATSGSKSLPTKSSSSSSFVRAFKNRLSLRRSRRKVKVKVDVTRTKSDPRGSKSNRYEDDKMLPKQSMKEESVFGSIVSSPEDFMKIVEIHRPQGKPFGFFVARGTVNNIKGIFISRIDISGEKAYQGLLEIGDRLIEIDGNDVTEASVIQVNQLMSNKTKLTLKIVPFSVLANKP